MRDHDGTIVKKRVEPKGDLARYAFGYSDKKPGKAFWIIQAGIILFGLVNLVSVSFGS